MSKPLFGTQGNAKVDKLLSQFSIRYSNANLIADQIMPVVKVKERTGLIPKYGKDNLRVFKGGILRKPNTRARTVEFTYANGQYICQERSVEIPVPWENYKNTDNPYEPTRDATATAKDIVGLDKEYNLASAMNDASVFTNGTDISGDDQWDQLETSDPIAQIFEGIKSVHGASGRQPNCLMMGIDAFWAFKVHPVVRDYIKFTNGGQLTDAQAIDMIKSVFNVKNVFIGDAVFNDSSEPQTDSLKKVWSGLVMAFYRPDRPTLMEPALGYCLTDVPDVVDGWGEVWKKRDMIRDTVSFDQNITDVNMGYVLRGVVDPS